MGCNCGGSTPRTEPQRLSRPVAQSPRHGVVSPPRRAGGPGTPDYYWNGPVRAPLPPNAPAPEPASDDAA